MDKTQTHILGTKLDLLTPKEAAEKISYWLGKRRLRHLVTLNPEICLTAESNETYRRSILKHADLTVADGFGLRLGGWLLGTKVPRRITGMQLVALLCQLAVKQRQSIYLLGGSGDTAKKAAAALQKRFSGLRIAGFSQGPSRENFSLNTPELAEQIRQSRADILLVAFGAPKQEQWIHANKRNLGDVKIAVGVGGIFDYLAGNVPFPPKWMRRIGLEWAFRLFTQKNRFKRVTKAVFVFPWRCLVWKFRMTFVYRANVIGAVLNDADQLLLVSPAWSKTTKWQFPQGGIDRGEDAEKAVLREMSEELGTDKLEILAEHDGVYRYIWPKWYQLLRGYKGQKQDLFLLRFTGDDDDIDIALHGELSEWRWAEQKEVLKLLAKARKEIGEIVLEKLR